MNSDADSRTANRTMILISMSVFLASSTWFSGTAANPVLRELWELPAHHLGSLTTSVQLGFIIGTLLYALLNIADVFNARKVFFISALLGALFNAAFALLSSGLEFALVARFLTGLTLAGVYPVGMKLIASWFKTGLGWRLGVMVGALALGTGFPYLITYLGGDADWRLLSALASLLAVVGGSLILFAVSDGPYLKSRARFDLKMMLKVFQHRPFRNTAFGYFGHMWELYAVWSMLGFFLAASFGVRNLSLSEFLPLISFAVIAMGAVGCALGGWISQRVGERSVALVSLLISAGFCLSSALLFNLPPLILIPLLLIWGFVVVSDSPQFSALATQYAPSEYTGTALTIQNGIGFAITLLSIQITPVIADQIGWQWAFTFLAIGPLFGAFYMRQVGGRDLKS